MKVKFSVRVEVVDGAMLLEPSKGYSPKHIGTDAFVTGEAFAQTHEYIPVAPSRLFEPVRQSQIGVVHLRTMRCIVNA